MIDQTTLFISYQPLYYSNSTDNKAPITSTKEFMISIIFIVEIAYAKTKECFVWIMPLKCAMYLQIKYKIFY